MKLIKIPLAVAAVFSLGIAGIAPALADTQPPAPAHRPHVAKGQSAPGARNSAALSPANDNLAGAQFLPSANNSVTGQDHRCNRGAR